MNNKALRLSEHLRKYLLLYIMIVILISIVIGHYEADPIKMHKNLVKNTIIGLAILTLLPSMIQLRSEKLGNELKDNKLETILGVVLMFLVGPAIAITLAGELASKPVSIGFVAANSVPASSASIAYVLLAEGSIEFATLLAIISIVGALGALPAYVGLYAKTVHVEIPLGTLGESIILALFTPFIIGQLARYYLIKKKARQLLISEKIDHPCKLKFSSTSSLPETLRHIEDALECIEGKISKAIKPYLSIWTMIAMLLLIGTLIAAKAELLIKKPELAGEIIGFQLIIYATIIACLLTATKLLNLSYETHTAMAFISLTKNQSVAVAVSIMAIGPEAAIPAVLIPAIQPVIAILYLEALPIIKRKLGMKDRLQTKEKHV